MSKQSSGATAAAARGRQQKAAQPAAWTPPIDEGLADRPLLRAELAALGSVLLAGAVIRAILLPAAGHVTDIGTFESWTQSLIKYGTKAFYEHGGFSDYPPGYMLVLWAFGAAYHALFMASDFTLGALKIVVKLPAVISDLALAYLIYLIARRTWPARAALVAMGIVAFSPAIWFVSAYWGQVDSVAAVFLVWSIYLAVTDRFEWSWAVFALAVLIKPHPAVVAPLLLLWQIRRQGWSWRLLLVPVVTLGVAYLGSLPFAPVNDPPGVLSWLYGRYHSGVGVYQVNSANAFNLYSVVKDFWQPDGTPIVISLPRIGVLPLIGALPQYAWGIGIFLALLAAIASRLWRTTARTLPESARERSLYLALFAATLGFFMLTTRMHERYMFSALAVAPLIWNVGRLQRIVVVVLSGTFLVNLVYALQYLFHPSPDLAPALVHPLSLLNVLCLFFVAGAYLIEEMGSGVERWLAGGAARAAAEARVRAREAPLAFEGLLGWTRLDYLIAAGLTAAAGVLVFHNLGIPRERIFDEIYYARAAQEYLQHKDLYEFTHPPLTKLLMTATVWLFPHLPDPVGARVASATVGTLTVPLLYGFARRLFSSTGAALAAVILLLTSGYHYVQSRIATPEITVAFFSLAALYCTYRFWIAAQFAPRRPKAAYVDWWAIGIGAALPPATVAFCYLLGAHPLPALFAAFVASVAALVVWYLAMMGKTASAKAVALPDGTILESDGVAFPNGERRGWKNAALTQGEQSVAWRAGGAEVREPEGQLTWRRAGFIEGTRRGVPVRERQHWLLWMLLASASVGCVVASKWNGLFTLGVLWVTAGLVAAQQLLPSRRYVWGNPFGWRLPAFVASTILLTSIIYFAAYLPYFSQGKGHGFADLVALQASMYHYHHDLKATHIYSSPWWTWPLELRPVSYYYHQFSNPGAAEQIVAEIVSLPNPFVWLAGLVTVPLAAVWAWRERHKGIMLCVVAYLLQWLPWIASTRIDFEYNFYPNLALICLCGAYVLQKVWAMAPAGSGAGARFSSAKALVLGYLALCVVGFVFFFPVWGADHITWSQWHARMWLDSGAPYGWI